MTTETYRALYYETPKRAAILNALSRWVAQRPGLHYANYGDPGTYRAELRDIARDKRDAELLLRKVELSSVTADDLAEAFRAFSGRLSLTLSETNGGDYTATLDYCTGQYWPTEYRKAVCAVLSQALWDHYRRGLVVDGPKDGKSPGTRLREHFRREYGPGLARRWFDYGGG